MPRDILLLTPKARLALSCASGYWLLLLGWASPVPLFPGSLVQHPLLVSTEVLVSSSFLMSQGSSWGTLEPRVCLNFCVTYLGKFPVLARATGGEQ